MFDTKAQPFIHSAKQCTKHHFSLHFHIQ